MASDLEDRLGRALRAGDAADRKRPVVPPPITDTVAPLGPNGRAIMEERQFREWRKQPSPCPTVLRLLADTKAVILRRRQECYGGLSISDEQADELSRALVQHLLGSYEITGVAP